MRTVYEILARASDTLQDVAEVRWTRADLLRYASDGEARVCAVKPGAYSERRSFQLAPSTKQTIASADVTRLLEVVRNLGEAGTTPSRAISPVTRQLLDSENINWHSKPTSKVVEHYVYEPDTLPREFFVYPKPSAAVWVEIVVALDPPVFTEATTDEATTPHIDRLYHDALVDYIVFRALSKDAEHANNLERAQMHARAFFLTTGVNAADQNAAS